MPSVTNTSCGQAVFCHSSSTYIINMACAPSASPNICELPMQAQWPTWRQKCCRREPWPCLRMCTALRC